VVDPLIGVVTESLDDIRDTASHAPVGDSGAVLTATLTDPTPAECTVVDLGDGEEWITSRLYVVATLVARMRGLRIMVFTGSGYTAGRNVRYSTSPEGGRICKVSSTSKAYSIHIEPKVVDVDARPAGSPTRGVCALGANR
jgi:hypothetical protein